MVHGHKFSCMGLICLNHSTTTATTTATSTSTATTTTTNTTTSTFQKYLTLKLKFITFKMQCKN